MSELEDQDYVAGHHIVFKDDLGLTEEEKHMMEETVQLSLIGGGGVFATSAGRHESLAVERCTRPDGQNYLLVRKATAREKRRLFGS